MDSYINIDEDRNLAVLRGKGSPDETAAMLERLAEFPKVCRLLVDQTRARNDLTPWEIKELARVLAVNVGKLTGIRRVGAVVSHGILQNRKLLEEAVADYAGRVTLAIFTDIKTAQAWLDECPFWEKRKQV